MFYLVSFLFGTTGLLAHKQAKRKEKTINTKNKKEKRIPRKIPMERKRKTDFILIFTLKKNTELEKRQNNKGLQRLER